MANQPTNAPSDETAMPLSQPVVVGLGAVDPALVTPILGNDVRFVADPDSDDLAAAVGAIVRADAVWRGVSVAKGPHLVRFECVSGARWWCWMASALGLGAMGMMRRRR